MVVKKLNQLKKFMQVGVDVTCMYANFGWYGLTGFVDKIRFHIWTNFPFGPWTIIIKPFDTSLSLPTIEKIITHMYGHFTTHFSPNNPCSYHLVCLCSKCSNTPTPPFTLFSLILSRFCGCSHQLVVFLQTTLKFCFSTVPIVLMFVLWFCKI